MTAYIIVVHAFQREGDGGRCQGRKKETADVSNNRPQLTTIKTTTTVLCVAYMIWQYHIIVSLLQPGASMTREEDGLASRYELSHGEYTVRVLVVIC